MKTKSALSYFGSDSEVSVELAAMLNACKHVTIPFCGGLSILPNLTARAVVANDLHKSVINFYRVASGVYGEVEKECLLQRCRHTLSHPDEIEMAFKFDSDPPDSVSHAWAFWALCWIGRKGKGGTKSQGGKPSIRRTPSGGANASRIRAAATDLVEWTKQFERCEWESVDFRVLLREVKDVALCGVYCDSPWVGAGKNYLHSFVEKDHVDLADQLRRFEHATIVVRYGDDPLVRKLYSDVKRWRVIESSSRDQTNTVKGELWITNRSKYGGA